MSDVIRLGGKKKKKKWASVGSQLERMEKFPMPLRILTSPKTTVALATTLSILHGGALLPTLKTGAKYLGGVMLAEGMIGASPKIEEFAKRKLQPEKVGKYIGEQIEGFGKEKEDGKNSLTFKEKVKEGLKKAGLIGGAIAGAGALALGVSKAVPYVKSKLEERKLAQERQATLDYEKGLRGLKDIGFTEPRPVGVGGVPLAQPTYERMGAPDGTKYPSPIQNIIQIQVT